MNKSDVNYDEARVTEGIKLVDDYIDDVKYASDLINRAFEAIKKGQGTNNLENKMSINEDTINKLLVGCSLNLVDLNKNIAALVTAITKFDDNSIETNTKPTMSNNNFQKHISEKEVKDAIKDNIKHNNDLTSMFNVGLYDAIKEELKSLEDGVN